MWTKEWPKKKGTYWFYGWMSNPTHFEEERRPELHLVKVGHSAGKTPIYTVPGQFMFKEEGIVGFWQEAILPGLPALTNYEEAKDDQSAKT